jgi:hypothetical protein
VGTTYTLNGQLTLGQTYKFKVKAQNGFGFSDYSEEISILYKMEPMKPSTPLTKVISNYAVFMWEAPIDHGSAITSYTVFIRKSNLEFIFDLTLCDGTSLEVLINR